MGSTMIETSPAGLYKQKEEVWFDDGREDRLLHFVQSRLSKTPARPEEVIRLIDEFGVQQNYMMNVGTEKGRIVAELIANRKPEIMVELGGYIGYSTILFASAVRDNGGKQYISFEREPKFARVAGALVDLAGLSDIVRIVIGSSSQSLVSEHTAGRLSSVDLVFLDHYKPAYVKDLKILESIGAIKAGSVLAADNVIEPGNPTYLEYVRSTPEEKMNRLAEDREASNSKFPTRTVNQYSGYEEDATEMPGVPEIVYKSELVHSFEPTGIPDGVEITTCKQVPK